MGREVTHVLLFSLEGKSISLSEAKSQVCQLLATKYIAVLEESRAAAPGKVVNMTVVADDVKCEADWEFTYLTGGPYLGR